MRLILKTVICYTTICCLVACDPCRNLECLVSDYSGQFRFVSKTDGSDLLFGPRKTLNADKIFFYSLSGADTTFYPSAAIRGNGNSYDSVLQVRFSPGIPLAYIRLSNGDTDTLQLTYKTMTTRCCGNITTISNFKLNDAVNLGGNNNVSEINK